MALTTVADYKVHAKISGSGEDTRLAAILAAAEAWLIDRVGREFVQATYTHTFDGNGGESLQLREYPVTSITSVTEKFPGGSTAVLDSETYRLKAKSGLLYRTFTGRSRFPRQTAASWLTDTDGGNGFGNAYLWNQGYQNYTVVYVAGYATIPDNLKYTIYRIIDWFYKSAGEDPTMLSESIGAYSYTRAPATESMPPDVALLVRGWESTP